MGVRSRGHGPDLIQPEAPFFRLVLQKFINALLLGI